MGATQVTAGALNYNDAALHYNDAPYAEATNEDIS
jgi:hypothetical protein